MLHAKEGFAQLAVQDKGLPVLTSGITGAQCPGGIPVSGGLQGADCVRVRCPPSAPGKQEGKQ